jgi:hypothetical protein
MGEPALALIFVLLSAIPGHPACSIRAPDVDLIERRQSPFRDHYRAVLGRQKH